MHVKDNTITQTLTQTTLLVVILISALLIRLHGLSDHSIWLDEATTIYLSELPLSTLWVTAYDPTPPLFYTIEKLILLFGETEFLLRLPSVIFGVSTIYLIYRAAFKTAGYRAAIAAAVFLTFSSGNIEYSQEAIAYALLGFCISGAFLGLVRINAYLTIKKDNFRIIEFIKNGGALYFFFTILSLYTHNTAVFFVFAVQIYFFVFLLKTSFHDEKIASAWIITNGLIFVLWLPWLTASFKMMGDNTFIWLEQVDLTTALETIRSVHGFIGIWAGQPFIDLFIAALLIIGLYGLRKCHGLLVLCLATLIASSVIIWLFGFFKPVFLFRTILWGTLITAFVIGVGAAQFNSITSTLIISLLLLLGIKNTASHFELNWSENQNWTVAISQLQNTADPEDIYIICASYHAKPFVYYANSLPSTDKIYGWEKTAKRLRHIDIKTIDDRTRLSWQKNTNTLAEVITAGKIWLVEAQCNFDDNDNVTSIYDQIREAGFEYLNYTKYRGVELHGFIKSDQ